MGCCGSKEKENLLLDPNERSLGNPVRNPVGASTKRLEENLRVVDIYRQLYETKNTDFLEPLWKSYSSNWTCAAIVLGNRSTYDFATHKTRIMERMQDQDWYTIDSSFKIIESNENYVHCTYITNSSAHGKWYAVARFDFDSSGKLTRTELVSNKINGISMNQLANPEEYERCRQLNENAINAWRRIWETKDSSLVDGIYLNHYSSAWTGYYVVVDSAGSGTDLDAAKQHTLGSLKDDWKFLSSSFKIVESTDRFVQIYYATNSPVNGKWYAIACFTFDPPGMIVQSEFIIKKA